MIEYLVITCDTNHRDYQRETVHARDIDVATSYAVDNVRNRFVVLVVELDHAEALVDNGALIGGIARDGRSVSAAPAAA